MPAAAAAPAAQQVASPPRLLELGGSGTPSGTPTAATAPPAQPTAAAAASPAGASPAAGPAQARGGASLLRRALALMPLASGITQILLGIFITKGTISLAGVPLLGSIPKFIVGSLVASTAGPSVISAVMQLLGKGPATPRPQ